MLSAGAAALSTRFSVFTLVSSLRPRLHGEYLAGVRRGICTCAEPVAVHESVVENLDTAVRKSLKSSADERRERLASANRQPEQVVVLI